LTSRLPASGVASEGSDPAVRESLPVVMSAVMIVAGVIPEVLLGNAYRRIHF
jgi:hypothetical protein